ncbi:MAG: hypothetical protein WKF37_09385 [Bryobacteraceae bacterium]
MLVVSLQQFERLASPGAFPFPLLKSSGPFLMELYKRWIDRWETKLATRDTNRLVRPFEWGFDWLPSEPLDPADPAAAMSAYAARAIAASDDFFRHTTPSTFDFAAGKLTFQSSVDTPHPENNLVHARFFPAANDRGRAVLVLPQWNSDSEGHIGLCRLLNKFGISALRMSKAYHDIRRPVGVERADHHMSANIGRTTSAMRQSILDARCCLDWLEAQGYQRLAMLGTSLGSCIAFITAAHDTRLTAGVFNHVSMHVADVVWTGISTRHVRAGFEGHVSQDELRRYWAPISPATYLDRMSQRRLPSLLVWARYDTTFLPEFSRQVLDRFRSLDLPHKVMCLPCAHYTTGQFPFNWMDGLGMCRFLARTL